MPYMLVCLCCPNDFEAPPDAYNHPPELPLCPRCQAIYDTGRDPARTIWPDDNEGSH